MPGIKTLWITYIEINYVRISYPNFFYCVWYVVLTLRLSILLVYLGITIQASGTYNSR